MIPTRELWITGGALAALAGLLWLLADVLVPFALGGFLAYLLDPLVRRVERVGTGRTVAVTAIVMAALAAIAAVLLAIGPPLVEQLADAARALPGAVDRVSRAVSAMLPVGAGERPITRELVAALERRAEAASGEALAGAWAGGKALLDVLGLVVVTPVVTFYLLLDWQRVLTGLDGLIPPRHRPLVHDIAGRIDRVLAGFLRGQLTVCLILGAFYAGALSAIGLPFALAIGLASGLLAFIPVLGASLGGILSIGVAIAEFHAAPLWIVAVAGVYLGGQLVEGNLLYPSLVGREVRLHPVWLLFALSAFGALFGLIGVLLAVPAAAVLGVLGREAVARYRRSALYRASSDEEPPGR